MEQSFFSRRGVSLVTLTAMLASQFGPIGLNMTYATVIDSGNIIAAPAYINNTNSGNYTFNVNLNGTLDTGDVVRVDVTDTGASIITLTGSNNGSGGIQFPSNNLSSLSEGIVTLSGTVTNSGGTVTASGITTTVTKDTVAPTVTIGATPTSVNSGSTSALTFTLSESSVNFASGDVVVVGGTL
ncbi:hypothetical protein H7170_02130, partial [Candidatus Gracilibacteria bacterium]|nr:hypothetical protein [Candidatus Gracilibacteria bacterium]